METVSNPMIGTSIDKIPRYVLYGDTTGDQAHWFMNVEHLAIRCSERGWHIPAHSHPKFGQLIYVASGRGTFHAEHIKIPFESPCVVLIPLNAVHELHYEQDSDGWVLTIAEYFLRQIVSRLPEFNSLWSSPAVLQLKRGSFDTEELRSAIVRIERELEQKAVGQVLAVEAQLMAFFLNLLRHSANTGADLLTPSSSAAQVKLVDSYRDLIEKHYRQPWKIGDFAAAMGVSEVQLRHACESVSGQSPIKMLLQRKLTEANRNLLFTDMSVEQIAYWLGFSSPAYFTRFYKKETGVSPAQFRLQNRQQQPG